MAHPIPASLARVCAGLLLMSCIGGVLGANTVSAQSNGDFRSRQTGTWDDENTWEEYSRNRWQNTRNTPDDRSGAIWIRSGHTVTADGKKTGADELTVEAGATLRITKELTIADGSGTDLLLEGALLADGSLIFERASSFVAAGGSTIEILDRGEIVFDDTSTGAFQTSSPIANAGTISFDGSSSGTFDSGTTIQNTGTFELRRRGTATISGLFVHTGSFTLSRGTLLTFASGAVLNYAQDGGSFPSASETTFAGGSTVLVTGVTSRAPSDLDNAFDTFIWRVPAQTDAVDLGGEPLSFSGNIRIEDTGSGSLIWDSAGRTAFTVGSDLVVAGGTFVLSERSDYTASIAGDLRVSAGSLDLNAGTGSATVDVSGDVIAGGTLTASGSGSVALRLTGSTRQTLDTDATISGTVSIELTGAGTTLGSDLRVPLDLSESAGGMDAAGFDVSAGGSITFANALTNANTVTMDGVAAASLSIGAGNLSVRSLVVEKPGSTLTLGTALEMSSGLVVRSGTFDTAGNSVVLASGATVYASGTVTGDLTHRRTYGSTADGWRMLASPVDGVSYSDLNTVFHTQGASWASYAGGAPNLHTFDFATQGWSPQDETDGTFAAADAAILYAFAENQAGDPILPATWTVTGPVRTGQSRSLSWSGDAGTSYNLVGNPTGANLDWNSVVASSSGVADSYATWDPDLTDAGGTAGYRYYDATSGVGGAGRYTAPFSGFMAQATAAGATMQFPTSEAANSRSASSFGKTGGVSRHISLQLKGEGFFEPEMYLVLDPEASDRTNRIDVERLNPLATSFATLWSVDSGRGLVIDGRDLSGGRASFDIAVGTTRKGVYTLSWPIFHEIPASWTVELVDRTTGRRVDMRSAGNFTFLVNETQTWSDEETFGEAAARFQITITTPAYADAPADQAEPAADTPRLAQNYPNPFNPATTVRFSVPDASHVRVEIFDILGRRVAVLVDEVRQSGWNAVAWRADHLSSGMYVTRLTVGVHTETRTMILQR